MMRILLSVAAKLWLWLATLFLVLGTGCAVAPPAAPPAAPVAAAAQPAPRTADEWARHVVTRGKAVVAEGPCVIDELGVKAPYCLAVAESPQIAWILLFGDVDDFRRKPSRPTAVVLITLDGRPPALKWCKPGHCPGQT